MDEKLSKRVDYLYRSCKQMPLLCVLSLLVPILLPFVLPLCIVYAAQRRRLLVDLGDAYAAGEEPIAENPTAKQIAYLRAHGGRFYYPIVAVGVVVVILGLFAFVG